MKALDWIRAHAGGSELPPELLTLARSSHAIADVRANLLRVLDEGHLAVRDRHLVLVASAAAAGSRPGLQLFTAMALAGGCTEGQIADATGVANSIATMNGYFKFRELSGDPGFDTIRSGLSGTAFMKGSLTPLQAEMICLAVSAMNDCALCVRTHLKKARHLGLQDAEADEVARIGAVGGALARTLASL